MIILFLFAFSFHVRTILAIGACENRNITHSIQDDSVLIHFSSNQLLKFDRSIRCNSSSPSSFTVNGCAHQCTKLGYGERDKISIDIHHENGTIEEFCVIDYTIPLQSPTLADIKIVNNKVRLDIDRPLGSFDYVEIHCSDNQSHIIFNTSIPSNTSPVSVDCSFLSNMPLMSFVLTTVKKDFDPQSSSINHEVPLPILFTHSLDGRLLTVIANAPPTINMESNYEFQLLFDDQKNASITYERVRVSNLNPKFGEGFNYSLIPNLKHTIIFKHFAPSMGYAQSNRTIPAIPMSVYPFAVTNLRIKEEFKTINLTWTDNHDSYDPIEYLVVCNSTDGNSMINVARNTTFICEQMTFQDTDNIAVQTRVTIAGYIHDQIAIAKINVTQIPEIPAFEVFNATENSISVRWNSTDPSSITNSFRYKINCSLDTNLTDIDIQSNKYQCHSLAPGTLYIITIFLENIDGTIQRASSINAKTLLEKCQYRNHFYSPNLNGTHSLIIEWSPPPEKNFDEIQVHCPSSYTTFQSSQTMPIMFVKCMVTNGIPFNVTFATARSGYEWAVLQFTDILTIETTTTVISTTSTTVTSTTSTTVTTRASTTSTTVTTRASTTSTTVTTRTSTTSTTTIAETSTSSSITTTATTTVKKPTTSVVSQNDCVDSQAVLTRWRTIAIIALIVAGFLLLATISLIAFFVLLFLRNRSDTSDE